jgi:hypothetical protein
MRENSATGFVRGAGHSFSLLLGIRFPNLNAPLVVQNHWLVFLKKNCDSLEGHGDVLQDLGGGEAGQPTGAVLQAPLGLTQVFQYYAPCEPNYPRYGMEDLRCNPNWFILELHLPLHDIRLCTIFLMQM